LTGDRLPHALAALLIDLPQNEKAKGLKIALPQVSEYKRPIHSLPDFRILSRAPMV
jgi:hypothetical protein